MWCKYLIWYEIQEHCSKQEPWLPKWTSYLHIALFCHMSLILQHLISMNPTLVQTSSHSNSLAVMSKPGWSFCQPKYSRKPIKKPARHLVNMMSKFHVFVFTTCTHGLLICKPTRMNHVHILQTQTYIHINDIRIVLCDFVLLPLETDVNSRFGLVYQLMPISKRGKYIHQLHKSNQTSCHHAISTDEPHTNVDHHLCILEKFHLNTIHKGHTTGLY